MQELEDNLLYKLSSTKGKTVTGKSQSHTVMYLYISQK